MIYLAVAVAVGLVLWSCIGLCWYSEYADNCEGHFDDDYKTIIKDYLSFGPIVWVIIMTLYIKNHFD